MKYTILFSALFLIIFGKALPVPPPEPWDMLTEHSRQVEQPETHEKRSKDRYIPTHGGPYHPHGGNLTHGNGTHHIPTHKPCHPHSDKVTYPAPMCLEQDEVPPGHLSPGNSWLTPKELEEGRHLPTHHHHTSIPAVPASTVAPRYLGNELFEEATEARVGMAAYKVPVSARNGLMIEPRDTNTGDDVDEVKDVAKFAASETYSIPMNHGNGDDKGMGARWWSKRWISQPNRL